MKYATVDEMKHFPCHIEISRVFFNFIFNFQNLKFSIIKQFLWIAKALAIKLPEKLF